jgi:phage terminase small subunit
MGTALTVADIQEACGINARQAMFAMELAVDLNQKQAAIRAGYSPKTAENMASQLCRNLKVQAAIRMVQNARAEKVNVDADWVLRKLIENVERSMTAVPVTDKDGTPTGEYRYEGSVANKALELIGKHIGMKGFGGVGDTGVALNIDQKTYKVYIGFDPREV